MTTASRLVRRARQALRAADSPTYHPLSVERVRSRIVALEAQIAEADVELAQLAPATLRVAALRA